ncbi:hypothetical protein HRI_000251100 [Hibiscus trionum]|uniref:Zinc finger PMZ-type domain-containing protein n=1 Tax=Hibiscus trionum TaxID=183268 RepID=A0A9W7GV56_HIBTR|nr:hypothetical protein HRI_000251100 [Hibiscus trionum]
MGIHSSYGDLDFGLGNELRERSRERSPAHRPQSSPRRVVIDEALLFHLPEDASDEEPIREPGPDGDELGPFYPEPEDLTELPEDPEDTIVPPPDLDEESTATNFPVDATPISMFQPPSHFTTVDMDAMNVPDFPHDDTIDGRVNRSDGELRIGMAFSNKEIAVAAVKQYNLRHNVETVVAKTQSTYYKAYCVQKNQGCKWKIRISDLKRAGNHWKITKLEGPHTCTVASLNQDHKNLDAKFLADIFSTLVKTNPTVSVPTCQAAALAVTGFRPGYSKAWYARKKAKEETYGRWEESYKELRPWLNLLQKHIPRMVVKLDTVLAYENDRVVRGVSQFHRLFWTFPQCINAFKHYKLMVQIDGTWLYGRYTQILLLAIAQNDNRKCVPVAFAIVPKEDLESWTFFLQNLRKYVLDHVIRRRRDEGVCVISDRGTSLLWAIENLGDYWKPPYIHHHFCLRHIAANYLQKYKNRDERQMVLDMGNSHYKQEVADLLEELRTRSKHGAEYLEKIPKEKWLRSYDEGKRYGHMTTNLAEAVNSSLKGVRQLPITSIVKTTYYRLATLFATLGRQATEYMAGGHKVHPDFRTKLHTQLGQSRQMQSTLFSREGHLFRVAEFSRRLEGIQQNAYVVDLRERTCESGIFQTFKYPCAHAIAACTNQRIEYMHMVDPVYLLKTVLNVYEKEFPPIGNEVDPNAVDTEPIIRPDPALLRAKGRPRSTRLYCAEDMVEHREKTGQKKHCSICRNPGHSAPKCPNRSAPRIN